MYYFEFPFLFNYSIIIEKDVFHGRIALMDIWWLSTEDLNFIYIVTVMYSNKVKENGQQNKGE